MSVAHSATLSQLGNDYHNLITSFAQLHLITNRNNTMTENTNDKPDGVTTSQMLTRMGIYAVILGAIWYFSSGDN